LEVQMKKLLVLAAAALLAAVPAAAQQGQSPGVDQAVAVEQVATVQQDAQQHPVTPSIFVSRQEIQQRVAAMEAERNGESAQMNQSFWYLVAAIALGVLIALLLAD
jgi:Flp pilus assembly protein TadB